MVPHRDVWRDLPYVVADLFKGAFGTALLCLCLRPDLFFDSFRRTRWISERVFGAGLMRGSLPLGGMDAFVLCESGETGLSCEKRESRRCRRSFPSRLPRFGLAADHLAFSPRDPPATGVPRSGPAVVRSESVVTVLGFLLLRFAHARSHRAGTGYDRSNGLDADAQRHRREEQRRRRGRAGRGRVRRASSQLQAGLVG